METNGLFDIWSYISDAMNSTQVSTPSAILKMLVSLILGGIIGFERKRKGQIAGVRTFALISMGATLAMLLSIYIPQEYLGLKNGDPGRIAAQVVTGIGFLGAGAIIQMKGSVRGLTTAAGIWIVATIGMAVGAGLYLVAVVSTFFIMIILVTFEKYERKINLVWETKIVCIEVNDILNSIEPYKYVFHKFGIHIIDEFLRINYSANNTTINFVILLKDKSDYVSLFDELKSVNDTLSISLSSELNI
ncbi:MAG: MgtC/SapB family protein [Muribaculaceae bacterium]|nr:MgtC/SapB family protein [Muribaculaceae bacterium]